MAEVAGSAVAGGSWFGVSAIGKLTVNRPVNSVDAISIEES